MDAIDSLIRGFKAEGWLSEPYEQAIHIITHQPAEIPRLVRSLLHEVPKGPTFFDASLSYLPLEEWQGLIEDALNLFRTQKENDAAEAVIAYASLQCVTALHAHLETIFELKPNERAYCANWPWRDSGMKGFEYLKRIVESPPQKSAWEKAWRAMLETRDPSILSYAMAKARAAGFDFAETFASEVAPEAYLFQIGYEMTDGLRCLYSARVNHLAFEDAHFADDKKPVWLRRQHPTWHVPSNPAPAVRFGGPDEALCHVCGGSRHHLITFDPMPNGFGVSGIPFLRLVTCLSCLGWEQQKLFYRHDRNTVEGIAYSGPSITPQFPAEPLKPCTVHLIETEPRWKFQDWGLSNSRENLNRLGGHPSWIQSAEYPSCPECGQVMAFLLQLDSDLPTTTGEEWLWGSGGICYVFWCDKCKISSMLWQCT